MKISSFHSIAFTTMLLSSTMALAQNTLEQNPQPMSQQVQIISGGIGDSEIESFNAEQRKYKLKLVFAENTGEYVSNVHLRILASNHTTLVDTASAGPIVLVNLKPGTYTMVSAVGNETKTQTIAVKPSGHSNYTVHFRSSGSQTSNSAPM